METKVMRDLQATIDQNGHRISLWEKEGLVGDERKWLNEVHKTQTIIKRAMAELVLNRRELKKMAEDSEYF